MSWPMRRVARAHDEAGFALAFAMFTLVLIGALVAGAFLPGRLEQQSGSNVIYASQAEQAAEAGLAEALAVLEASALEPLVAGDVALDLGTIVPGDMLTAHTTVARLNSRLFLIRTEGARRDVSGRALATRHFGLLVRLASVPGSTPEDGALPGVTPLAERSRVRLD